MTRLLSILKPVLVLCSVAVIASDLGNLATSSPSQTGLAEVAAVVGLVGFVALPLALTLLYLREVDQAGTLGLLGYVIAMVGAALLVGMGWAAVFVVPVLFNLAPNAFTDGPPPELAIGFLLSPIVLGIGLLIFGIATWRAGVLNRVATMLMMLSAVVSALPFVPIGGGVLGGLSLIWFALASSPGTAAYPPAPRIAVHDPS